MILVEKVVELKNGYYIDSWYDRQSKNYITQLKDPEGNEVDYRYSGDNKQRFSDIDELKNGFLSESKKKKKEPELPMTGLTPIIPDPAAGISKFNSNNNISSSGEASGSASTGGSGE